VVLQRHGDTELFSKRRLLSISFTKFQRSRRAEGNCPSRIELLRTKSYVARPSALRYQPGSEQAHHFASRSLPAAPAAHHQELAFALSGIGLEKSLLAATQDFSPSARVSSAFSLRGLKSIGFNALFTVANPVISVIFSPLDEGLEVKAGLVPYAKV
jgi:hypothetical protein